LGIRLADEHGPWPELEDIIPSQFADDDADGFAGVSVDVTSLASVATAPNVCSASNGNGNGPPPGRGNPMTMQPATTPPTAAPFGRLPLGLRTQLTAAMRLAPDCTLSDVTASDASVGLRAAGCFVTAGADPATASAGCSEEIQAEVDRSLPSYEVLDQGDLPSRGAGNTKPSAGTLLQVVRLPAQPDCAAVRKAMF
jgi:hypothetical protein